VKILLAGAGGVGEAMAILIRDRGFAEKLIVADIRADRAAEVAARVEGELETESARLDASDADQVAELARATGATILVNACDPRFVPGLFDGAFAAGIDYMDMAMSLSSPHPERPYEEVGVKLGDMQWEASPAWEAAGRLAFVGMGVEPGMSDCFAKYAADHLFSEIEELGVRDGANLVVEGYEFAPTFSIWTTIEECLNPPIIYERGRGFFTTEPFSEPEVFDFPEGIGPVECVNVEHEEVLLMSRYIDAGRVTFKYGLGDEFIGVLKTLHKLGLDRTTPVSVRGGDVSPRDVVAACLPDPATLGDKMKGRSCAGTWVKGKGKDGAPREVYLHHVADNEETIGKHGCQAVVWQTAIAPALTLELLASGVWQGAGVLGPEAFDAVPMLDLLKEIGEPWGMIEMTPGDAGTDQ
jgi:saccharopine dehydrogenase (NAD+, L-lysine-forming)